MSFPISCQLITQLTFSPQLSDDDSTSLTQLSVNFHTFSPRSAMFLFSFSPISLSCSVCCANCAVVLFPVLVIVARAEECIWRSYPSCPRATWDAEKQEMLYILNPSTSLITSSFDFHYSLHFFHFFTITSAAFEIWIHLNFSHLNTHQLAASVTCWVHCN